MDTSVAIKQDIAPTLNATQGHKHSYQQAITSILNSCLHQTWFDLKSEYLKRSSDYN